MADTTKKPTGDTVLLDGGQGVCNFGGEATTPAEKVSEPPGRDYAPPDDWGHLSDARHRAHSSDPDDRIYTTSSRR